MDASTVGTVVASAGPADLLRGARQTLAGAGPLADPVARYRRAHLAAVRGAAAATGALTRPTPTRAPQRTVWSLLAERAPELTEWAWFLARVAPLTLSTGDRVKVGERDADDLLRQVGQFLDLLERALRRTGRARSACAVRTTVCPGSGPGGGPPGPVTNGGRR